MDEPGESVERHNYWVNRSFIAFDTETTGLDFENDRIIQAAVAVFSKGQQVWSFNWLLNTDIESSAEAVAVHGITDEYRKEHGIPSIGVMLHLCNMFRRMQRSNAPVVAFNAPFDFSMFRAELKRFSLDFNLDGLHVYDPLVVDRHYQKNVPIFTAPFMRQSSMAARYGLSIPTHDALDDAICAGHIALAQSIHHSPLRSASPAELDRRQAQWHSEFAAKVNAFASKKDFKFYIPQWPFGDMNGNQEVQGIGQL
jgi:DNA polymerase III subunit epsilon